MISDGAPYAVFAGAKQASELITLSVLGVIFGQSGNHIAPQLSGKAEVLCNTDQVTWPQPGTTSLILSLYFSHIVKLIS